MTNSAAIALFGWIAVVLVLFVILPRQRAAAAAFVSAWLFLPDVVYPIAGLPDFSKVTVTCVAPLLSICIFDFRKLISLRPCWADAPILLFCLSPFASSLQNGLGTHDGISVVFAQSVSWGVPYAIGRVYFDDLAGLRELAAAIFVGGVVYIPFSLFELWIGPKLNKLVYGYSEPGYSPVVSFGIVRPMVFMQSGLMLAFWMAAAAVAGIWLWKTGALPAVRGVSLVWLVPVLIATVILLRSVNGWIAMVVGVGLLLTASRWRTAAPAVCAMVLILAFIGVRAAGLWSGEQVVYAVRYLLNDQKGHSIEYRFLNEDVIAANVRPHLLLGWGRQMSPFFNWQTGQRAVPDSLWIIVFANFGVLGLLGFTTSILSPVVLFIRRLPAGKWGDATVSPAAALAVLMVLYMTDHLANAMENPVFMLAAGGLSGFSVRPVPKVVRVGA